MVRRTINRAHFAVPCPDGRNWRAGRNWVRKNGDWSQARCLVIYGSDLLIAQCAPCLSCKASSCFSCSRDTPLWEVIDSIQDDVGSGGENIDRARRPHGGCCLSCSTTGAAGVTVSHVPSHARDKLCVLSASFNQKCALCIACHRLGVWQILPKVQSLPSMLPLPSSRINLAFDELPESEWLHLFVLHSDAWLAARALCMAHALDLPRSDRQSLARAILAEPPLYKLAER